MPSVVSPGSRIRSNISAENAMNSIHSKSSSIAQSQLRISTGKQLNQAADNVSGYITAGALSGRNSTLKSALKLAGEASNLASVALDAYENITNLISEIKNSAATASASSLGTDEIVSLGKGAYRLAEQIQFIVDSTVFGGRQLLYGNFSSTFVVGTSANEQTLSVALDLSKNNDDFNINSDFVLNSTEDRLGFGFDNFAGVSNLNLSQLANINSSDLGIFSNSNVKSTIVSLADALDNIAKVSAYLGGIQIRLTSQYELLNSQITNYDSAISRITDADIANEELALSKNTFLQQSSLISLSQANIQPLSFIRLFASAS